MYHEERIVLILDKHYLKHAAAKLSSDNKPFIFIDLARIRPSRGADNFFRVFRRNAMPGDMRDIPTVPSEFHIYKNRIDKPASQLERQISPASSDRKRSQLISVARIHRLVDCRPG